MKKRLGPGRDEIWKAPRGAGIRVEGHGFSGSRMVY
jgi:hypothetical protein